MSVQTAINRFIVPPNENSAEFYQQLLTGFVHYEQLGNRLIHLSEEARVFRQFEKLSEYALILSKLPSKKYQTIGQYYLALSLCRTGRGELNKAKVILEKVASTAPLKYRAEAMVSLSSIAWDTKQPDDTLRYCVEASKISRHSITIVKALRGIAVLKSFEGYHRFALRDLESLYPIIKYAPPHIYFDYMNSLAVELAQCDRLEEARNVSRKACSSPLVSAYPEWRETAKEIALRGYKSRSAVSVVQPVSENVVQLPVPENPQPVQQNRARILNYVEFKKKMGKKTNGEKDDLIPKDLEALSDRDLMIKIFQLSSQEDITREQLLEIVSYIIEVTTRK